MTSKRLTKATFILPVIVLATVGILLAGNVSIRYLCAYVLVFILPGFGVVRWILGRDRALTPFERVAVSLAAGYPIAAALTLVASYVPGKLTLPLGLAVYAVGALLPWLLAWLQDDVATPMHHPRPIPTSSAIMLGIIILVAGVFCFANLGVSEFQGDEVMALLDGGSAIQGNNSALFFHRKGPAEIMFPMSLWVLTGTITEWMARLPFAIAGLLAVIALYMLGRRAFNEWTGLAAAALLAINGYLVGFSRIVQYQSIVMMTTAMAVLCFYLFSRKNLPRYQILGAAFVATGLLAHYDGVFALPVIVYLYGRDFKAHLRHWRTFVVALLVGVGLVALFYVPFLHPAYFAQTSDYLRFRSGGKPFYNNLSLWFVTSTTYNSTYYVIFLIVLALSAVLGQMRDRRRWLQAALGLAFVGMIHAVAFPDVWQVGEYTLVFTPFLAAVLLTYLVFEPLDVVRMTEGSIDANGPQMALVWFAVPFLIYSFFLVKRPGTHFWTMYFGLALLGALGLNTIRLRLQKQGISKRVLAVVGAVLSVALLALFAYYLYLVFIRVYPEYRSGYPGTKSSIYWTAYEELPPRDYFGFPHKAGWKAISALYDQGILDGEYDSNEGGEITAWYLPQAPRHYCRPAPKYYFVTETVQDAEKEIPVEELATHFSEVGLVTVAGRPGIHIYERDASQETVAEYVVEEFERDFDRNRKPWDKLTVMEQFISTPYAANFGQIVELVGYDLDIGRSCPGGEIVLTLYWRRKGLPIPENYKVFAHLEKDKLWAQADDVPGCAAWPTTNWREGEIVVDRHIIELEPDVPPGEYSLSIGLYEPNRGTRLDWLDDAGQPQGDSLNLTSVNVE